MTQAYTVASDDTIFVWDGAGSIAIISAIIPDFWRMPPGFYHRKDINFSLRVQPRKHDHGFTLSIPDNHLMLKPYKPISAWTKKELSFINPKQKKIMAIAEKSGWSCHYCGLPLMPSFGIKEFFDQYGSRYYWEHNLHQFVFQYDFMPELEHVIPRSMGGKNSLSNYVLACSACNAEKHTQSYWDYVDLLWQRFEKVATHEHR